MLNDKVIVVTGGAGRIGKEFIKAIVDNNGIGVIADIDIEVSSRIRNEIVLLMPSAKIEVVELDIASEVSVQSMVNSLHRKYNRIDVLVNNAYPRTKNYGKKIFDINVQDFNDFVSLHLGGYFNVSQKLLEYFLIQGHGNIINISSIQGIAAPAFETYEGTNMHSPIEYTVAKHGLVGMTKYLAKMFKKNSIRVNAISPGGILDQQPDSFLQKYKDRCGSKGMLSPADLNGALIYLASDVSQYMTGQNLVVDDGFSL